MENLRNGIGVLSGMPTHYGLGSVSEVLISLGVLGLVFIALKLLFQYQKYKKNKIQNKVTLLPRQLEDYDLKLTETFKEHNS